MRVNINRLSSHILPVSLRGWQGSKLFLKNSQIMTAEVKGSCLASVINPVKSPTGCCFWISVFLLLIFSQQFTSLFLFDGVFICSTDVLISPFRFCLKKDGQVYCSSVFDGECDIKINMATTAVILALYIPVVLVAFALLAMLFTVYTRETATLTFSMICQAASSLLILAGIIFFLLFNWQYLSWEAVTPWFYMCMGVQVELIITTVLINILARSVLVSDWK